MGVRGIVSYVSLDDGWCRTRDGGREGVDVSEFADCQKQWHRIPEEEMHWKEMEILGHTSASSLHSKANEAIAS